jgi:hypothetical protein
MWVGLTLIGGVGLGWFDTLQTNPYILTRAMDYRGNICGYDINVKDKPYGYFMLDGSSEFALNITWCHLLLSILLLTCQISYTCLSNHCYNNNFQHYWYFCCYCFGCYYSLLYFSYLSQIVVCLKTCPIENDWFKFVCKYEDDELVQSLPPREQYRYVNTRLVVVVRVHG